MIQLLLYTRELVGSVVMSWACGLLVVAAVDACALLVFALCAVRDLL